MAELNLPVSGKQIRPHFHYPFLARQIPTGEWKGYITHTTKPRYCSTLVSPQPHMYPAPGEGSVPTALQCPDPLMPQHPSPLRCTPQVGLLSPQESCLSSGNQGTEQKQEGGSEGKEFLLHPQGFCLQPRARKSPLPLRSITLLVTGIASSHGGGKVVLLVAIIKMGRGRHLLFSATAEIAFLAQTFWS